MKIFNLIQKQRMIEVDYKIKKTELKEMQQRATQELTKLKCPEAVNTIITPLAVEISRKLETKHFEILEKDNIMCLEFWSGNEKKNTKSIKLVVIGSGAKFDLDILYENKRVLIPRKIWELMKYVR